MNGLSQLNFKKIYYYREKTGADGSTYVTFPSFLRGKSNKLMPSKEIAKKIGKDIIDDNQEGRYDVINEAFINVEADKPGGR